MPDASTLQTLFDDFVSDIRAYEARNPDAFRVLGAADLRATAKYEGSVYDFTLGGEPGAALATLTCRRLPGAPDVQANEIHELTVEVVGDQIASVSDSAGERIQIPGEPARLVPFILGLFP